MEIKTKLSDGSWVKQKASVKKLTKPRWYDMSEKKQKPKKKVNGTWTDNF